MWLKMIEVIGVKILDNFAVRILFEELAEEEDDDDDDPEVKPLKPLQKTRPTSENPKLMVY